MSKRVLMIATGGTIASKPSAEGLTPQITAQELLCRAPDLLQIGDVSAMQLMNIDSTNMSPEHWLRIAACVKAHYAAYDGFVITHGTDTMAYTAAALSYLIQDSGKPVILTGAQHSIFSRDTDARRNLMDAFLAAADADLPGVYIVFDGKVICGTRARKMRTKSLNAFSSVDWPEVALLRDGRILHVLQRPKVNSPVRFSSAMNPRVFALRLLPGMDPNVLQQLEQNNDALVIESFGMGGLPCYDASDFASALQLWTKKEKPVVITTQVPHEGSDLSIYEVGRRAAQLPGIMEAHTMTLEAVVTKLMWILGEKRSLEEIHRLFYTPVANDLLQFDAPRI